MATQTIEFRIPATPAQVTLRIFVAGSETQVAAAVATKSATKPGAAFAAFTDLPAGEYECVATQGTAPVVPLSRGFAELTAATAVFPTYGAAKAVNLGDVVIDPEEIAEAVVEATATRDEQLATIVELLESSGQYRLTVSVVDAVEDAVPGAIVQILGVAGTTRTTGTDGPEVIDLDPGPYTLRVTVPAGYEPVADQALVVAGDATVTVTVVATNVAPPSNPALSTLQVLCLDASGAPEEGVLVDARIVTVPTGSTNTAFRGNKQTATSGADGIATFEVPRGAKYQIKRGTGADWQTITIGSGGVTTINSFIGSP